MKRDGMSAQAAPRSETELTERQRQVLRLIARGKTNAEIGDALGISLDGAKWHVSEILAKLEVGSREDAAEWWNRRERPLARMGRVLGGLIPGAGWVKVGGAVAGLAAVAAAVIVVLALRSDDGRSSAPAGLSSTSVQATAATPPSTAIPDGPVAFRRCRDSAGFRKLTPSEMQDVFTNPRFGDGVKPGPFYWAMYLSDFYWNRLPQSISANVENVALSQGTATAGASTPTALASVCVRPDWDHLSFQALTLYDHHVLAMHADGGILTIEVEPRPSSMEYVEFPEPSPPRSIPPDKNDPVIFQALRIVDATGHLMAVQGPNGELWEFGHDGRLRWGTISSFGSPSVVTLRVATDLELFCGQANRSPATVTFKTSVRAPVTVNASCGGTWDRAGSAHLDPGEWTIAVDGSAYFTVLPADSPRP